MMSLFDNALNLEKAVSETKKLAAFPYNPAPVISKVAENGPVNPFAPVKVFDNVYWVGSQAVGAVVIDTGDGYVMIDDGSNDPEAQHMAESLEKLGIDGTKIKLIIISHEHFDHYGGTSYFLKNVCPDAKIAISRIGWNLLQTVPTEFAFTDPRPEKADILLADGMCLEVGNTKIFCILTPGHSDGCVSFIFNAEYKGEEIMVGMMGGSATWPNMPQIRMYQSSIEYFKLYTDMAGCNAFALAHRRKDVLDKIALSWSGEQENPWVCTKEEYDKAYLTQFRNNALRAIKCDEVQLYMMPASPVTGHAKEESSPIPERM
ncbi:MAG: MBL fold metallo-hydrolase [Oscillospiraceae bacterium]|nr:MBL fold metallo-hydrolase [Oscillospiraceae bacterium]